jgi:hypothetical protein
MTRELLKKMRGTELENLEKKKRNYKPNRNFGTIKVNAHSQWLGQIEK